MMAVFVDPPVAVDPDHPTAPKVFKRNGRSAHLMADTEGELTIYAKKIGMNVKWLQFRGTKRSHFDVTGKFLEIVLLDEDVLKLSHKEFFLRYSRR